MIADAGALDWHGRPPSGGPPHLKEIYEALGRTGEARAFERRMESLYKKAGYL